MFVGFVTNIRYLPKIVIPEQRCLQGRNSVSLSDPFLHWSSTGGGVPRTFCLGYGRFFGPISRCKGPKWEDNQGFAQVFCSGDDKNVNSKSSPGVTHSGRSKSSTSDQNKQRVKVVMDRDRVKRLGDNQVSPRSSGRRNALALDKSAWWRLAKELRYHPYKPVKRHELQAGDLPRRLAFCQWLVQLADDELLKIVTSDEASFLLNGHVNFQNVRCYAPLKSSDPINGGRPDHFAVDHPTFSQKLMVFCGMKRDGTFCLKFFRNENLTGATYHRLLQYHALPQLRAWNGGNLDGIYWQQDGQKGFLFENLVENCSCSKRLFKVWKIRTLVQNSRFKSFSGSKSQFQEFESHTIIHNSVLMFPSSCSSE